MHARVVNILIASCTIVGALCLALGTYLHPGHADPNDAQAAFAEYAMSASWVPTHLLQLLGIVLMLAALLLLLDETGSEWTQGIARLAKVGAGASLAASTMLQAVDGIALKRSVDIWAAAPAGERDAAFYGALAVRQIEIGLASVTSLLLGITVVLFCVLFFASRRFPLFISALGMAGGVLTFAAGLLIAGAGFSGGAMMATLSGGVALIIWMILVGIFELRTSSHV